MSSSNKNDIIYTCSMLLIFTFFIVYVIYKFVDYQSKPLLFREGMTSNNCSISDLKSKITKIKEQVEGTIDVSKNKADIEDVISDMYDIVNYQILASICSSNDPTNTNNLFRINVLMDNSAGLQRLMKWLDGKSGSSSSGGMFG